MQSLRPNRLPLNHQSSLPSLVRNYAISVQTPKPLPGKKYPRIFKDKKAFQYNWYSRILQANASSPVLILHHNDFSAQRLKQLRADIFTADQKAKAALAAANGPAPISPTEAQPTLTVVRTSIFGAAMRDLPGVNMAEVEQMVNHQSGSFAVLSLPSLNPPQLSAILRAMDKSVPPKAPKTPEEIKAEQDLKKADPAQPGRRMKRSRQIRIPELKLMGAIIENRVFLPQTILDVSKLPTLPTLHAQIVGLLSAPASQLAAVLGEASGGRIARTLEGLKLSLQAANEPAATDDNKVES